MTNCEKETIPPNPAPRNDALQAPSSTLAADSVPSAFQRLVDLSASSPKLIVYMADLLCFVPDGDKYWAMAPRALATTPLPADVATRPRPKAHQPYLLHFSGDTLSSDGLVNFPGRDDIWGWVFDGHQITISTDSRDAFRPRRKPLGDSDDVPGAEDRQLDWLLKPSEFSRLGHTGKIKEAVFGPNASPLIGARLVLDQGDLDTIRFAWIKRWEKYLRLRYLPGSALTAGHERAVANVVGLAIDLPPDADIVTLERVKFDGTGAQQWTLKPNEKGVIELLFGNLSQLGEQEPEDALNHFVFFYNLLEGWSEPSYQPRDGSSYGPVGHLQNGAFEDVFQILTGRGRRKPGPGDLLDPAIQCDSLLASRT